MAIEVGMILEGKVSGITKFGAFVDDSIVVKFIGDKSGFNDELRGL